MESKQAAEHLQVIRTLMERSALYRRALAPIMTFAGLIGIAAAALGVIFQIKTQTGFVACWMSVAMVSIVGAFLLVRRQALKSVEPFWTPPARRVAQALLPSLFVGLALTLFILTASGFSTLVKSGGEHAGKLFWLPGLWAVLYGCALHAAGFFTSRGLRLFGWVLIGSGLTAIFRLVGWEEMPTWKHTHLLMGFLFGFLHLGYGIYLYFTENRNSAP